MTKAEFCARLIRLGFVESKSCRPGTAYEAAGITVLVNSDKARFDGEWQSFDSVLKKLGMDVLDEERARVVALINTSLQFAPKPCREAMIAARALLTKE